MPITGSSDPVILSGDDARRFYRALFFQCRELVAICSMLLQTAAEQDDGAAAFKDVKLREVLAIIGKALRCINKEPAEAISAYSAAEAQLLDYDGLDTMNLKTAIGNRIKKARKNDHSVMKRRFDTLQIRQQGKLLNTGPSVIIEVLLGDLNFTRETARTFIEIGQNLDLNYILWFLIQKGRIALENNAHFYKKLNTSDWSFFSQLPLRMESQIFDLASHPQINLLVDRQQYIRIKYYGGEKLYGNIWESTDGGFVLKEINGKVWGAERLRRELSLSREVRVRRGDSGDLLVVSWDIILRTIVRDTEGLAEYYIEADNALEVYPSGPDKSLSKPSERPVENPQSHTRLSPSHTPSQTTLADHLPVSDRSKTLQNRGSSQLIPRDLPPLSVIFDAKNPRSSQEGVKHIDPDPQNVFNQVNQLDAMMAPGTDPKKMSDCAQELTNIYGRTVVLPQSYMLTSDLRKLGDSPIATGAFGAVWKGMYDSRLVAIKALKVQAFDDKERLRKNFCREVVIWKHLSHVNIVTFLGISMEPIPFCIILEWMPQGHLREYVKIHSGCDRLMLLRDVANGTAYLHSLGIIHADLKGNNILINEDGRACLCDFGLASFVAASMPGLSSSKGTGVKGTIRWMAPELFEYDTVEDPQPTAATDMYALSMVALEICTGEIPFRRIGMEGQVIVFVCRDKKRPQKPSNYAKLGLSENIWRLIQQCWDHDPTNRPTAHDLLGQLHTESLEYHHPISPLGNVIQGYDDVNPSVTYQTSFDYGSPPAADYPSEGNDVSGVLNTSSFVDRLELMTRSHGTDQKVIKDHFQELTRICGERGILPSSYILNSGLSKLDNQCVDIGTFGEVWRGKYGNHLVAIKELELHSIDNPTLLRKDFCKGAVLWKQLSHINIVPFLGVSTELNKLCIVSGWIPNGNIRRHVGNNPGCDRIPLLCDVTSGLSYLHDMKIIHGNLKGDNILIDEDGRACICDFGLASMKVSGCTMTSKRVGGGMARWMAPELFDFYDENDEDVFESQQSPRLTASSDVYALCMVFLEIFTGQVPFANVGEEAVLYWVNKGTKPDRPVDSAAPGLTDEMWMIMQAGWRIARERPPAQSILEALPMNGKVLDSTAGGPDRANQNAAEYTVASWMLGGNDQEITDRLDQMMISETDPKEVRNYVRELMEICGRTGILPSSYMLNSGLSKLDNHCIAAGKSGEVWRGKYGGRLVAIKELKVHSVDKPERLRKDLCKEAVLWKRLSHINIVPFLGVSTEFDKLCIVTNWMPNGNIRRYVWNNMECDRIPLLWDVTSGLSYLHYMNVIHGDLKGDNFLINDEGRVCLCDFGLASMKVSAGTVASTKIGEGTLRWMAPELFDLMDDDEDEDVVAAQQSPRPTASSDVYALCMVFLEIFTGKLPFANVREEAVILWASRGKKPDRPVDSAAPGLTSEMWMIMQAGWRKADERPTVQSILEALPVPVPVR